jgi:hypothetical protein
VGIDQIPLFDELEVLAAHRLVRGSCQQVIIDRDGQAAGRTFPPDLIDRPARQDERRSRTASNRF